MEKLEIAFVVLFCLLILYFGSVFAIRAAKRAFGQDWLKVLFSKRK